MANEECGARIMNGHCEMKNRGYQLLSAIPTADLVRELAGREGVEVTSILPGWEYGIEKNPPDEEDDDNEYCYEGDNPERWTSLSGEGPATILVVKGVE